MLGFVLVYWLLQLLALPAVRAHVVTTGDEGFPALGEDFKCSGGTIYFAAHPIDALLYQNPDLYHDIKDTKCTTLVIFTASDRGQKDSTESLEYGLEASYDSMAGGHPDKKAWDGMEATYDGVTAKLRFRKDENGLIIVYLRIPDGGSDGQGYSETGQVSLKRLYQNKIQNITSVDGVATYDLGSLKKMVHMLIGWKNATIVRTLDHEADIAEDGDFSAEHADHVVSARIVHEVIEEYNINAEVVSYGGNLIRNRDPNNQDSPQDFDAKANAYFAYAQFDKDACKTNLDCFKLEGLYPKDTPEDIKYTTEFLDREYTI